MKLLPRLERRSPYDIGQRGAKRIFRGEISQKSCGKVHGIEKICASLYRCKHTNQEKILKNTIKSYDKA